LAATLYNLRTGKDPIPANFRDELKIPLPEPKQLNPQIPDWENAAILKGLELEAAKRPQSVAEWLKLLGTPPSLPLVRGGAEGGEVTTSTCQILKEKIFPLQMFSGMTQLSGVPASLKKSANPTDCLVKLNEKA